MSAVKPPRRQPQPAPARPIVPRLWPGSTVAIIASGPSLTVEDVDYVRGKAHVIVINASYTMAPWADVMYSADRKFWYWHKGAPEFTGAKYGLQDGAQQWGVTVLRKGANEGLSLDPSILNSGFNSGYQAIGLAVHLGASRIVLLGYDMQRGVKGEEHWHGEHPNKSRSNYQRFLSCFPTLVAPLKAAGVEVVNCTRRTALECFPKAHLRDVLKASDEVAA